MKAAWEIAMEKANSLEGKKRKDLTAEQKERIAEIRRVAESKIAEAKIMMDSNLKKARGEAEAVRVIQENFQRDRRKIEERAEADVEKIRNEG